MFKYYRRFLLGTLFMAVLAAMLGTVSAQSTFGTNWLGSFYASQDLANLGTQVAQAQYPNGLNFNWPTFPLQANGQPVPGMPADRFSVIFTSSQNFPTAGAYTFSGSADDVIRVSIDNIEVFRKDTAGPGNFQFVQTLTAGVHNLQVSFIEYEQQAVLQFQWILGGTPGITGTPVPTGPIGSVVNVRGLSLRTGPYLGGSFIAVLRPNIIYSVTGKNTDEGGGYTWYRVTAGDKTGWASGRYLTVTGVENVPVIKTVFEEIDTAADLGVRGVPRAIMNLRRRPSERSQLLLQIPWGGEVQILNRTVQGGRNKWFQVRYGDKVGWIFAPYVTIRGDINLVPIR